MPNTSARRWAPARRRPEASTSVTTNDDPKRFARTAIRLEELGLAAYNGAATSLTPDALADAARIVSVEARHAAWIRDIAGANPAPRAAEPPDLGRRRPRPPSLGRGS